MLFDPVVPAPDFNNFLRRSTILKGHLLSDFTTNLQTHTTCAFHCMTLLLNEKARCENHNHVCSDCAERFTLLDDIQSTVFASTLSTTRKRYYQEQLRHVQEQLDLYIAHLVREKYQRMQFMKEVDELRPGKAVVVRDYMMYDYTSFIGSENLNAIGSERKEYQFTAVCSFFDVTNHRIFRWKYTMCSPMATAPKIVFLKT